MISVEFGAVKSKKLDASAFVREWSDTARDFANTNLRKQFNSTMATFRRKFPIVVRDESGSSRIAWACIVEGEIYVYVSEGTSVRWAVMSPDWKSKTRPGRIKSGRGQGRVVIAGRRAMLRRGIAPRPGIQARDFPTQIARKEQPRYTRVMVQATEKAAKGLFK